jgi:hypothetical protein
MPRFHQEFTRSPLGEPRIIFLNSYFLSLIFSRPKHRMKVCLCAAHGRETPGLERILGMEFAVLSALRPYSLCVTLIDEHENPNGHQYKPILQGKSANSTNNYLEVFGPYLGLVQT